MFPNLNGGSAAHVRKASRLTGLLAAHPSIMAFLAGRRCSIVLARQILPAEIIENPDGSVTVRLAAYYFESYDIGYVAGMICHEFGVHSLADRERMIRWNDGMYDRPTRTPGGTQVDPTTADQRDHAIAAIPDSTRHNAYRRVVLEMAELLFQEEQADPPRGVLQDVTDLLDCYLMDLASIAATNDDRFLAAPFRAGSEPVREALAAAYQEYKARLWRDPAVSTQIKALLPPTKTADTVEQQYLAHMWRAAKGVFGAPSIRRR